MAEDDNGHAQAEVVPGFLSIRTPRADSAKLLASIGKAEGETGSGPRFAGEEDNYFLDGIEEVLAQWEPEVGKMAPVDADALDLSKSGMLKSIKTPSKKKMACIALENAGDDDTSDLDSSTNAPRCLCIDDTVFLDGLEEVVPEPDAEECEEGAEEAGVQKSNASQHFMDVITPLDIPAVAVSTGKILAPKPAPVNDSEKDEVEGPMYSAPEDAFFHEGVEEVVADWKASPAAPSEGGHLQASLLSEVNIVDVKDTFFLDGLEEATGPALSEDQVGYMPPAVAGTLDERPAPIRTHNEQIAESTKAQRMETSPAPPAWSAEDDATFLDTETLVNQAVEDAIRSGTSGASASPASDIPPLASPAPLLLSRHLRVRTISGKIPDSDPSRPVPSRTDTPSNTPIPSRTDTPSNTPIPSRTDTPSNTPTSGTPTAVDVAKSRASALASISSGAEIQGNPYTGAPAVTATPINLPADAGYSNTPDENRNNRSLGRNLQGVQEQVAAQLCGDGSNHNHV